MAKPNKTFTRNVQGSGITPVSKEKGHVTDMNGLQTYSQMFSNACKAMLQGQGTLYLKLFCVIKLFVCVAFVNF